MTTKEIQKVIGKMQVLKFHSPVCENVLAGFYEMDVMSLNKAGYLCEIEVKISRSDFKADAQKTKHRFYRKDGRHPDFCPNYFSYACPTGLIKIDEVPEYAGLYYVENGVVTEIKRGALLHKIKRDKIKIMEKVCRLTSERHFLGCARLTYENNELKRRYKQYTHADQIKDSLFPEANQPTP